MNAQLSLMPPEPAMADRSSRPLFPPRSCARSQKSPSALPDSLGIRRRLERAGQRPPLAALSASAIPTAELAELEAQLSRAIGPIARRLVADAARRYGSISEIRRLLAPQIANARERADFLRTSPHGRHAYRRRPHSPGCIRPRHAGSAGPRGAVYLGPIAKVLVGRAARTARSEEELRDALAAEIPSAEDRRRFLAALRSTPEHS